MIGPDGDQLGIMVTKDALKLAEDQGLDLVEISPDARPPVCRILDYGKYLYDESKNAKKAKKRQSNTQLKEMRYRPKIDEHDINFKTEKLREFLTDGHKVRAYVEFRGREMTHTEFGYRILERIKEMLVDVGQPEPSVRMEGRHMSLIINPKKGAAAAAAKPKTDERPAADKPSKPKPEARTPGAAPKPAPVTVESPAPVAVEKPSTS